MGSTSDLVWRLYVEYGRTAFQLLEGLFVGALFFGDRLVLFASKTSGPSLSFIVDTAREAVLFTTELKAVPRRYKRLRPFEDIWDEATADRPGSTSLEGFRRVQAGQSVEIDLCESLSITTSTYYTPARSITLLEEDEAIDRVRRSVERAVAALPGRTASCLVSGGLDSSVVAGLARQRFASVHLSPSEPRRTTSSTRSRRSLAGSVCPSSASGSGTKTSSPRWRRSSGSWNTATARSSNT